MKTDENRWKQNVFIELSLSFHWLFIDFSLSFHVNGISRAWAEFRRDEAADSDLRLIRREEIGLENDEEIGPFLMGKSTISMVIFNSKLL